MKTKRNRFSRWQPNNNIPHVGSMVLNRRWGVVGMVERIFNGRATVEFHDFTGPLNATSYSDCEIDELECVVDRWQ